MMNATSNNSVIVSSSSDRCFILSIVSALYFLILVFSVFLNTLLLWASFKQKSLVSHSPANGFIQPLALLNLGGSLLTLPFTIISHFNCRWTLPTWTCISTGFVMYFVGCSCIYLMCLISYERYQITNTTTKITQGSSAYPSSSSLCAASYSTKSPKLRLLVPRNNTSVSFLNSVRWHSLNVRRRIKSNRKSIKKGSLILACLALSLFWSLAPFFGWSHYTFNAVRTSCAPEWKSADIVVVSYNLSVFLCVFLLPLSFVLIINMRLLHLIKLFKITKSNLEFTKESLRKRLDLEAKVSRNLIITIVFYCLSWAPYGINCMYTALIDSNGLDLKMELAATVLAKSSMVMTALTCIFTDNNLRKVITNHFVFLSPTSHHTQTSSTI